MRMICSKIFTQALFHRAYLFTMKENSFMVMSTLTGLFTTASSQDAKNKQTKTDESSVSFNSTKKALVFEQNPNKGTSNVPNDDFVQEVLEEIKAHPLLDEPIDKQKEITEDINQVIQEDEFVKEEIREVENKIEEEKTNEAIVLEKYRRVYHNTSKYIDDTIGINVQNRHSIELFKETSSQRITPIKIEEETKKKPHNIIDEPIKTINVNIVSPKPFVKEKEIVHYEPTNDFDISYYEEVLLEKKEIIPIVEINKEIVHYEPIDDFDISIYEAILLENKKIKPIIDVNKLDNSEKEEVHYEPIDDFDISVYEVILLADKEIKTIVEQEKEVSINEIHYEPINDFDVSFYLNILLKDKKELLPSNISLSTVDEENIIIPESNDEEVVEQLNDEDFDDLLNKIADGVVETNKQEDDEFDSLVERIINHQENEPIQNDDEEFDRLASTMNIDVVEDEEEVSISKILSEIEKNNYQVELQGEKDETASTVEDYIMRYPNLTERKIRSIYENILMMIQSVQPSSYVTLVHVISFEDDLDLDKYVQNIASEYDVNIVGEEVCITITVEVEEEHLCSHIIEFASQANNYHGIYKGWRVNAVL